MRLRLLKGALLVGAVLGFAGGAASVAWRMQRHHARHLAMHEAAWEHRSMTACAAAGEPDGAGPPDQHGARRGGHGKARWGHSGHWGRWDRWGY